MEGKTAILIGDSITKHIQRFASKYNYYFAASTVVNAGISGNTVEAVLYRVETMNILLFQTFLYYAEQTI